ncbi:hypothetical protein STANM309S_04424 [Streptomyces tanashiensis]
MGSPQSHEGVPNKGSVLLALRFYARELLRLRWLTAPALLLPALGNIGINYIAPLVVAKLVGRIAGDGTGGGLGRLLPYVLAFAGVLLLGEALWRVGLHCLNRLDARGIENLYVIGMDELFAKDAAFFHDNFAGSLTKRVLSFASRFEEFVDTLTFSVMGSLVPLLFASVVLWQYDPLLVVGLLVLITVTGVGVAPLIRRRQVLVAQREQAIARVSGHVADSLTNMDTVRSFGAERREAAEHRSRVAESRRLTLRSWDYGNLRIDTLVAPMSVLTNVLGLVLAVTLGGGEHGVEAVIVAFTYYANATRIMFEFNQIYRRLESSMTEAGQFTELLLEQPTVLDPEEPEPLRDESAEVRFQKVTFAHAGAKPLFEDLDLDVPSGAKIGFVGRSGGGKTTLTRLLLRMTDIDGGRITIGGQDISRLRQTELRSKIAYVPQDPAMFHRTLRENIAFARPDATEAEIRRAAEAAHVTEFGGRPPRRLRDRRMARGRPPAPRAAAARGGGRLRDARAHGGQRRGAGRTPARSRCARRRRPPRPPASRSPGPAPARVPACPSTCPRPPCPSSRPSAPGGPRRRASRACRAYVVFHDATLREIADPPARHRPGTRHHRRRR